MQLSRSNDTFWKVDRWSRLERVALQNLNHVNLMPYRRDLQPTKVVVVDGYAFRVLVVVTISDRKNTNPFAYVGGASWATREKQVDPIEVIGQKIIGCVYMISGITVKPIVCFLIRNVLLPSDRTHTLKPFFLYLKVSLPNKPVVLNWVYHLWIFPVIRIWFCCQMIYPIMSKQIIFLESDRKLLITLNIYEVWHEVSDGDKQQQKFPRKFRQLRVCKRGSPR